MQYREWQPPASLSGYVRYFWMLESDKPETFVFRPIPDGCPGLIFQSDSFFDQEGKKLPGLFLYGQTTRLNELTSAGWFRTFGVYLYPHALRAVFGLRADELTDSCLDLTLRRQRDDSVLHEQLRNVSDPSAWMTVCCEYLLREIRRHEAAPDPGLHRALERLQWPGVSLRGFACRSERWNENSGNTSVFRPNYFPGFAGSSRRSVSFAGNRLINSPTSDMSRSTPISPISSGLSGSFPG